LGSQGIKRNDIVSGGVKKKEVETSLVGSQKCHVEPDAGEREEGRFRTRKRQKTTKERRDKDPEAESETGAGGRLKGSNAARSDLPICGRKVGGPRTDPEEGLRCKKEKIASKTR